MQRRFSTFKTKCKTSLTSDFYEALPAGGATELRQGDRVYPIAFARISLSGATLIEAGASPTRVDLSLDTSERKGASVLASLEQAHGLVLNQSCDLSPDPGRERSILVARVVPCTSRYPNWPKDDAKKRLRQISVLSNPGKSPSIFYLPPEGEEASVADLLDVATFPPADYRAIANIVKRRLSPVALAALQERVAYCFGRFGTPDGLYLTDADQP